METKFVPLMVRVCGAAPGLAEVGERLVIVGTGLEVLLKAGVASVLPPPPAQEVDHKANAMQAVAIITTLPW